MVDNSNQADINVFTGATGCGKSTAMAKVLKEKNPDRLLIWDYKHEYENIPVARSLGELLKMAKTTKGQVKKKFKLRYCPNRQVSREAMEKAYSAFCSIAMKLKDVAMVTEEAHFVTRPNGGPPAYVDLITVGRALYGIKMYVTSQRPARIDKDILANSTFVYTGRLGWPDDEVVMAKTLKVPVADIAGLTGYDSVARNRLTGELLKNGKKVNVA